MAILQSMRTPGPTNNSISHSENKTMNETAERFNGWAAMLGVVAALGAYATTGQLIPGIW